MIPLAITDRADRRQDIWRRPEESWYERGFPRRVTPRLEAMLHRLADRKLVGSDSRSHNQLGARLGVA